MRTRQRRSQMFEEFLKKTAADEYTVEGAGLEPTQVNPLVVEVMKGEGVDLGGKKTQSVFDLFKAGRLFDYVITVRGETATAQCPIFPGLTHRLHMPFADPAPFTGTQEEKPAQTREVRDSIKQAMRDFIDDHEQFLIKAAVDGLGG